MVNFLRLFGPLLLLIAFVMGLSAGTASGFTRRYGIPFGVVLVVLSGLNAWQILSLPSYLWVVVVLDLFVGAVFTFGGIVLTTPLITWDENGISIPEGSSLQKMLSWSSEKSKTPQNMSLCKLSWLGMAIIVGVPLLYVVGSLVMLVIVLLDCFITGQNVGKVIRWVTTSDGNSKFVSILAWDRPTFEFKFFKDTVVPRSPAMWALLGFIVYWTVVNFDVFLHPVVWLFVVECILGAVLTSCLVWAVLYFAWLRPQYEKQFEIIRAELYPDTKTEELSNYAIQNVHDRVLALKEAKPPTKLATSWQKTCEGFVPLMKTIKGKVCPTISFEKPPEPESSASGLVDY